MKYRKGGVDTMPGHQQNCLIAITRTNPPCSSEAELHKILYEWNGTADEYSSDKCIHQLFEEQVEKNSAR